ncbi:Holliday junction branch migration protein RuvA [Cyanobium sp. FGCU-6]|jgi:Holliday junction DNA helicase RuvA|nr:Holliday junction branch migration protein RuvA [Cyanobium sp. FGCU6]
MIGWLQGTVAEPWQARPRCGLLLICGGVGYEVQLGRRQWEALPAAGGTIGLHIHHSVREDAWTLFGFPRREERELFRELVAVSGVGPQMALGLLGELESAELVRAIVQADLRRLSQAPGVGKRTAERLAVELRTRLQERYPAAAAVSAEVIALESGVAGGEGPGEEGRAEVQITLEALGYEILEVHRALRAVAAAGLAADAPVDDWIREGLRWLSRPAA